MKTLSGIEGVAGTLVEAVVAPATAAVPAVTAAAPAVVAGAQNYLAYLKVDGWTSSYRSIDNMLRHLSRKTVSEASRTTYLGIIYRFCNFSECEPDELVKLNKKKNEKLCQDFCDNLLNKGRSRRYVNTALHVLLTFSNVNGFRGARKLNVESYHVPVRYRKREEYIPTKNEVYDMADNAGSLKNRTIILALFSTGLRVSTLIALTYGDINEELEKGYSIIKIPVYADMKKHVPEACKGNVEYYTFASEEATKAIRLYLTERELQYGKIEHNHPLFASDCRRVEKGFRNRIFMTRREIEYIVKNAARRTRIKNCEHITPHCLRKTFESVLKSELVDGGRMAWQDQTYLMGHVLPSNEDAYYNKSDIEALRSEYARLNFGRKIIENRFKTLENALSKAFADTNVDWQQVLKDYVSSKFRSAC